MVAAGAFILIMAERENATEEVEQLLKSLEQFISLATPDVLSEAQRQPQVCLEMKRRLL